MKQILSCENGKFLLNGKPFTVISGAMHYFRIPREYWRDRLTKLKECGFNTVETYVCWNLHEEHEGKFDFSGMLDISEYLSIAESLGLYVILRPGPYICAEWEAGGLPAWLLRDGKIAIRCGDPLFLEKVKRYFHALFDELRPHFSANGGNIIMIQIENEYGSYGDDKDYLRALADIYRECGVDALLFTSDGTEPWMLYGGSLGEILCTANFGSNPESNFAAIRSFRPGQPLMCSEFWSGWFDHWYEKHHTRDASDTANVLDRILSAGASVNVYMFHGGTNFGFMNGANLVDTYSPTVTSYDYCAPLSECGDLTPSYYAIRNVIEKHSKTPLPPLTVKNSEKAAYGSVVLREKAFILDVCSDLSKPLRFSSPQFQEDIGQNFGFTLYSTVVNGPIDRLPLGFDLLRDRAVVYIDGEKVGILERDRPCEEILLNIKRGETVKLDILVENMGRVNYGPQTADRKGMTRIRFGQQLHFGWDHYPLEMKNLSALSFLPSEGSVNGSYFLRGFLNIDGEPKDTFIRLDGFHHGFVTVNGFNLGRYYNDAGPQKALYCPAPVLRRGLNTVVVFETDGSDSDSVTFTDKPDSGN